MSHLPHLFSHRQYALSVAVQKSRGKGHKNDAEPAETEESLLADALNQLLDYVDSYTEDEYVSASSGVIVRSCVIVRANVRATVLSPGSGVD